MASEQKLLCMRGLPDSATAEGVAQKIASFGKVLDVRLQRKGDKRPFAFIDVQMDAANLHRCQSVLGKCKWAGCEITLAEGQEAYQKRLERERLQALERVRRFKRIQRKRKRLETVPEVLSEEAAKKHEGWTIGRYNRAVPTMNLTRPDGKFVKITAEQTRDTLLRLGIQLTEDIPSDRLTWSLEDTSSVRGPVGNSSSDSDDDEPSRRTSEPSTHSEDDAQEADQVHEIEDAKVYSQQINELSDAEDVPFPKSVNPATSPEVSPSPKKADEDADLTAVSINVDPEEVSAHVKRSRITGKAFSVAPAFLDVIKPASKFAFSFFEEDPESTVATSPELQSASKSDAPLIAPLVGITSSRKKFFFDTAALEDKIKSYEGVEARRDSGEATDIAPEPFMRTRTMDVLRHKWKVDRPEMVLNYQRKMKSVQHKSKRAAPQETNPQTEA